VLADYDATVQNILANIDLDTSAPIAEESLKRYTDIPQSTSPEGFPQLGNPDAPVKIQEISSFACPACRSFHDFATPVLLERVIAGDVLFEYIPYIGTGHIPNNEEATRAAMCAGAQGKFWEYQDALFAWQDFGATAFLTERLNAGAEGLGLDMDAFAECMAAEGSSLPIENAVAFGNSLAGFVGTPTVLLNGNIVNWNPDELSAQIDAAIQAQAEAAAATTEPDATAEAAATSEPTAEATADQ
jgi:protein-disulfide isomerase